MQISFMLPLQLANVLKTFHPFIHISGLAQLLNQHMCSHLHAHTCVHLHKTELLKNIFKTIALAFVILILVNFSFAFA